LGLQQQGGVINRLGAFGVETYYRPFFGWAPLYLGEKDRGKNWAAPNLGSNLHTGLFGDNSLANNFPWDQGIFKGGNSNIWGVFNFFFFPLKKGGGFITQPWGFTFTPKFWDYFGGPKFFLGPHIFFPWGDTIGGRIYPPFLHVLVAPTLGCFIGGDTFLVVRNTAFLV